VTGIPTDHTHDLFAVAVAVDPLGRPVVTALLGQFLGAAFDGCASCQDPLLTLLTADPVTVGRLVELACQAVHEALGGLPPNLLDPAAPGVAAAEFRELAAAGEDGQLGALHARCARMTAVQRRAAANSAADLLVGYLCMGGR
jgi:hypothetical protein